MLGILGFLPYFLNLQHFLNKSRIPYIYGATHTSHAQKTTLKLHKKSVSHALQGQAEVLYH